MARAGEPIAAYSGGSLPAAVGIIRMSGEGVFDILADVFKPKGKKDITKCNNREMIYGEFIIVDEVTLDLCMACKYEGPRSYTGEDMVEIFFHGSEAVISAALKALYAAGARPAEAGEFTKRAYLNGKMTLRDAEATAELIYAQNEWTAKNAAALLKGGSYDEIEYMRDQLTSITAHYYAVCDYSDEDVDPFDYMLTDTQLVTIEGKLARIYENYLRASLIGSGIPIAIIGRPNVGKSSLFNALAGFERAIVTEEAGTTRDVVTQRITLGQFNFDLMDTAGIRQGDSRAEVLGIERSREAVNSAYAVIAVFDGSEPMTDEDREIVRLCAGKSCLGVVNKYDIGYDFGRGWKRRVGEDGREQSLLFREREKGEYLTTEPSLLLAFNETVLASAATGVGISRILNWIEKQGKQIDTRATVITSRRQGELIKTALDAIRQARDSAHQGLTADAFLLDAEKAHKALGQVLGQDVDMNIAEGIFSRFCVGK